VNFLLCPFSDTKLTQTLDFYLGTQPHALRVAGSYTVDYRAMSASGHSIVGSYAFTYEPPEDSATQRTPTPGGTAASSARGAEATMAPRVDGILVERAAGVVILLFAAGVVLRLIVRARRGRG
jgi:hypothetical protein